MLLLLLHPPGPDGSYTIDFNNYKEGGKVGAPP